MHKAAALLAATILWLDVTCQGAFTQHRGPPIGPYRAADSQQPTSNSIAGRELIKQCKVFFRNATLDHFSWVRLSFRAAQGCLRSNSPTCYMLNH